MPLPSPPPPAARAKAPHGVSFPVAELLAVQDWGGAHGMMMQVVIDHVLNGAAFEELLVMRHARTHRRVLCLWRRVDQVIAQRPDQRPLVFRSLDAALAAMAPAATAPRPRGMRAWMAWLTGK
jgi:hypothetical protein